MNERLDSSCGCAAPQVSAVTPCPRCGTVGSTVGATTPRHALKRDAASRLDGDERYNFCENPECEVVYYGDGGGGIFTTEMLKNRVTIKDDSPETPLCYCFKVLKKHALEEIARTGTTDVFQTIQAKMKPGQSCFCEKANPRGDTCSKDIRAWLQGQGVDVDAPPGGGAAADSGCGCSCG